MKKKLEEEEEEAMAAMAVDYSESVYTIGLKMGDHM